MQRNRTLFLLTVAVSCVGVVNAAEMVARVTAIAGNHQSAFMHEGFTAPLMVEVRGENGNPVPNARVRFAGPADGAGCDFGGAASSIVVNTDGGGLARANCVAAKGWGEFSITANVEGSTAAATFNLWILQGNSGPAPNLGKPVLGFPLVATVTVLTVSTVSAPLNSTTSLSARLTRFGSGLSGQTIAFTLNSTSVGSATTDGSGNVTLGGVSLVGIAAGTYPTGVGASYAGDAVNLASSGTASLTITAPTVPGAPTIGTATPGSGSAVVTFTAPGSDGGSAITGYTVTSSPGGLTGAGASSPITVSGLTNGTPYTFTVTATNGVGTGAASAASNSATPATVPDAPAIGTATAGNGSASVTFAAPGSNGGSTITGYTVTSSPGGLTGSGSTSPIPVTGLTNGTAYTFTVTATNGIGTSAASAASNSVTPVTVPGAPTIGTATPANTSASVSFTAPISNGGSAITGYTVTASPGGATGSGVSSPITVSGLTNGTGYTFTVTATNGFGTGSPSASSNSATPASVSGAPTIGTATPGNASASVSFTAPGSNGGSAITGYTVTANPGGVTGTGSTSPITVSGLTNGTAYTFTVTATNGIGASAASAASNSVTPVTVPGAPTIGSATAANAGASVSFTAPGSDGGSAITGYTVTSSPGGLTGVGSASPITVTGLTNGTSYSFTVTATNGFGTGSPSASSNSATPVTVPGAPAIGTATAGNGSASVTFTAPGSNGGSTITGYTVTSSPGGLTGSGSTSPITVSGLTNGTAYTFTVTATNGAGTGGASAASNGVTPITVPDAPTIGTGTRGDSSASVSFSAPASNGGSAITSYTVTSSPGGFTGTGPSSPITVAGLENGVAYTFTVTATNLLGTGAASAASNSVTPATVPGTPSIRPAVPGNGAAVVEFRAPELNGGSPITNYTVTSNPGGFTGTGSTHPITVTGLTNGTAYTFTVTATNGVGTSAPSSSSNSVIPATVPDAPTIGSATPSNGSASISFISPASNGGMAITDYTVCSTPGPLTTVVGTVPSGLLKRELHTIRPLAIAPSICLSPAGFAGSGLTSPIVVTGLTNGISYTFSVIASNSVGAGAASAGSNSVTPATVPDAPAIGTATPGNASASVTFTAPGSNGGAVITGYTVTSSPGGFTGTGSTSPITVTGLINGTAYSFTVTATNSVGTGPASAGSNSVIPITVPGAPTIGSATPANASASVSFTAPASTGGSAITGYTVTASPGGFTAAGLSSPIIVTGLANGTAYTFTVTATSSAGTGPASAASNSVTAATVPGAPVIGVATPGNGSASVAFSTPASNGGAAITVYTVTSNPGGFTGTGSLSPITVAGLSNNTSYTFTVTATNSAGTSPASAASNSVIPATVPGAPTIGAATSGNASASVTFTAPVSNGGATITLYTVTSSPGGVTGTGLTSPITVTGLTNGTAYTFTVTATNSVGAGAASAASSSVTSATVPGAPTIGNVTPGNGSATVPFTAPASNGGAAITTYTVTTHPGGMTTNGSASPILVTGLTNAIVYTFTVTATNSVGTGAASASSNSLTLIAVPDAPTGVSAAAGNASATVSFTAPANNGGAPVQVYTATSSPGNLTGTSTSSPITVIGLTNGTLYTFTVIASNSAGPGSASAPSNSVTPASQASVPGAPSIGSAAAGNGSAVGSFTAPANNGGSPITSYTVTSNPGGIAGTGSSSPITVVGLTNGVAYTFTVTATNSEGTGTPSGASNSVTPNAGVPGTPQQVHATSGNGQATVSFIAPVSIGSPITGYTVIASPGEATAAGSSSPITVSGLKNGASYTFIVTATNGAGTGAASDPSNVVTLALSLSLDSQSAFPRGVAGTDYPLQILTATGGTGPYTFALISGQVPGLTFAAPQLSGIPTQAGEFSLTFTVTDAAGNTASGGKSLSIFPAQADLILSQSTAAFSVTAGSGATPTPASITIRSSVVLQLLKYSMTVSPSVAWLDVAAGSITPGSLTIALNQAALALPVGANSTTITVTCVAPSPCAGNAQAIGVSLVVNAPAPQLALTTGLVSFSTGGSSTSAQSQTVGLQNVGGGSISAISGSAADGWLSVSNLPATLGSGPAVPFTVTANPAGLAPAYYRSTVAINSSAGSATLAVTLLISSTVTITLGPSGTQYYVPAGGMLGSSTGAFAVTVTGGASAAYSASVLPGAAWLAVTSGAGTAAPAAAGSVGYLLDPGTVAGLSPGTYYGTIRVVSSDAIDSPQDFLLALNVTAASQPVAPELSTGGLIFIATGGTAAPQTVQVFASSASPLNYQASAATEDGTTWLSVSPSTGTASAGSPGTSTISVNSTGLRSGVYRGGVSYAFSAASVRTVNITLIVPPVSSSSLPGVHAAAVSTCAASNLVGTQTGLVNNFARPVGLPVPLLVYLVNNCGTPIANAQMAAAFSNGDPLLQFTPVSTIAGLYTATWTPRNVSAQVTVTSSASIAGLANGSNQVTGEVTQSKVPILGLGLTLNAFNPLVGSALAPGTIVQIYGTNLATATAQAQNAPLPGTLGGTSVSIGGIAAPLFYVSPSQINAQVPWELRAGYEYQISVRAGGGVATPDSIQIGTVSPGIAALVSGGVIATHADGRLIATDSPARPSEVVIVYLTGLGATNVSVGTGAASPASPLAQTQATPTVTLNGASAVVSFAGLSPGSVGLYQINFQVPSGVPDGDLPLAVSQSGVAANAVRLTVHQ